MRIFTAVVSLIMAVVLYDFYNRVSFASRITDSDELSGIAGAALIGAFLWVVGGALVYFYPMVSLFMYLLSFAAMGLVQLGAAVETDMIIYMWFGPVFALTSFFGWRGKKKADAEKQAERNRQYQRDAMLEQMVRQQSMPGPTAPQQQAWEANDPQDSNTRPKWMS